MRTGLRQRSRWAPLVAASLLAGVGLLHLAALPLRAQTPTGTVVGQVVDERTRQGVAGARVQLDGSTLGTQADVAGQYRLGAVPAGRHTITVRRVGYLPASRTVSVPAGGSTTADFALQGSTVNLQEIVVTGTAGNQTLREIGNAVSTVNATDQMVKSQPPDLGSLINARASGVAVLPTSGRLGAGPNIQIRGISSIGLDNSPLIYIDGVRVTNTNGGGPPNSNFTGAYAGQNSNVAGRLNDISPSEIESIQIIKGPAAATIYGTEAANGVIQIITKKGGTDHPQLSLQAQDGAIYFRNAESRVATNYFPDAKGNIVAFNGVASEKARGTPIFKTGQTRQYNLGLSGTTGRAGYYISGNYQNDLGIEPNNSVRQFNGHANLSLSLTPTLDLATSLNYVQSDNHLGADVGVSALLGAEVGHSLIFPTGRGFFPGVPPEVPQTLYDNSEGVNRFTGSATLNSRPTTWFSQRLITGIDYSNSDGRSLVKYAPPDLAPYTLGQQGGLIGQAIVTTTVLTTDYNGTAKFNLTPRWTSATSIGGQLYRTDKTASFLGGAEFPGPDLNVVSATTRAFPSAQGDTINTTVGGYLQEEIGLNNRFFLTGALRVDNNSAFGENFKWITYPKLSASWVVNEEPFWHFASVNALKLRAAYGESGRAPGAFTALRTYTPVQGPLGSSAFTAGSYGNSNLQPERAKEFEGGFDAGLFDRLDLGVTYYNKHTTNEIIAQPVAPSTGFNGQQFQNLGQVNSHGVELQATLQVLTGRALSWEIAGNYATAYNKIVDAGGVPTVIGSVGQYNLPGYPIEAFFTRRVISATLDAKGVASNILCDNGAGAGVPCDSAPYISMGSPTPTSFGSIGNTVTLFGRLRLYGLVDWKRGFVQYNANDALRCTGQIGAGLCDVNYHPLNYSPVEVAEADASAIVANTQDQWIQDASFVKLRELSATYTFPDAYFRGIQRLSVTLAGRELGLWTNYKGIDPESNGNMGNSIIKQDQAVLPPLSRITATINLTF